MLNYEKKNKIYIDRRRWKQELLRHGKGNLRKYTQMVMAVFSKHKIMSEFLFLLIKKMINSSNPQRVEKSQLSPT